MNRRKVGVVGIILCSFFAFFWSCTKVDNTLGQSFIPEDQLMVLKIGNVTGINAYVAQIDSFPTKDMDYLYLGSRQSDEFGVCKAGFATQFAWLDWVDPNTKFGTAAVADSITLYLGVEAYGGDAEVERTYNMYVLKDRLYKTDEFYSNYDIDKIIDRNDVFFSFKYSGSDSISIKMTGAKVEEFMQKLIDTTGGVYNNDSLFINKFPGFYFAPADGETDRTSILAIDPETSGFSLYYHNYTDESATTVKDTLLATAYSFANHDLSPITTLNTFKYDYTGTEIKNINDTLTTSTPVSVSYVQGLGGVVTYLRFTKEFIQQLQSQLVEPYKKISINRAELYVPLADPTPVNLDIAQSRLGMYENYKTFTGSVDYQYSYETDYGIELLYDGNLNRSKEGYIMDISGYMHQLLNASPDEDYRLILGSAYSNADLFGFTQVALRTGPTPENPTPLEVKLTYTLIK